MQSIYAAANFGGVAAWVPARCCKLACRPAASILSVTCTLTDHSSTERTKGKERHQDLVRTVHARPSVHGRMDGRIDAACISLIRLVSCRYYPHVFISSFSLGFTAAPPPPQPPPLLELAKSVTTYGTPGLHTASA